MALARAALRHANTILANPISSIAYVDG